MWQRVNQHLHPANTINVAHLIEGRQYEFRIFAENDAGLSEPSSNSTQVRIYRICYRDLDLIYYTHRSL